MNLKVYPSTIKGEISAISSKSYAHRALICAALASSPSKIKCDNLSDDINATVNCLNGIGAEITYKNKEFFVTPIDVSKAKCEIDCGESGSTLRFILPIIGALGLNIKIIMHGRLPQRPLSPLYEQMEQNGCSFEKKDNYIIISGKLKAADYEIEGNISSQFVTGLLFSLPLIKGKSKIVIKNKFESYSYVLMTLAVLKDFGIEYSFENNEFALTKNSYHSNDCTVEGDWSNAAFWLCAGALSEQGIIVTNLNFNSTQGDKKIIDILKDFGADVKVDSNSATIKKSILKGITVNASDIPDLVPIICVVASVASGVTTITNAERLRIKESDRIKSVVEMIKNVGGDIKETADGMIINGCALKGGVVNSFNDHRIVMSAAVLSSVCENFVEIIDSQAVNKSYPMFFEDFKKLNGNVKEA